MRAARELIAAIVAGVEVMFRIGAATLHSPEQIGFHAPGMTGPFGVGGCLRLAHATSQRARPPMRSAIAGSLAGGLLAFAKAGSGGMVKRLHLGRAAESGVLAARLAQRGYEGPRNVIEGAYGVLEAFCEENDPTLLTQGLGQTYRDRARLLQALSLPRHRACAGAAAARSHRRQHGFGGDDIRAIAIEASDKVVSHHNERDPADIMLAQYSVPFCVAIAAYHDPLDPAVFCDEVVRDPHVRALAKRISVSPARRSKAGARGLTSRSRTAARFERQARHLARLPGDAALDRAVARSSSIASRVAHRNGCVTLCSTI